MQGRDTKQVPKIRIQEYEKRLEILGLSTLCERRERGDLIIYYNNLDSETLRIPWVITTPCLTKS